MDPNNIFGLFDSESENQKKESEKEITDVQQEMREAKADWEMVYYANAVHAFTQVEAGNDNSKGAAYNALADKRSWNRLKDFLHEIFQK
jgi:dienelactone hydrolase